MTCRLLPFATLLVLSLARLATGHGTAVELSVNAGKLHSDKGYYVSEAPFQAGSFLQGDLPGFEIASPASGIPQDAEVALRPVGKLWHWSPGTHSVADAVATLALSNALGEVREIDGASGEQSALPIAPYLGESPWHWHLDYFLAPLNAAPGGYAALFAPEATGLTAGDPFLLVFGLLGEDFTTDDLPEAAQDLVAAALGANPRLPGDANLDGRVDLSDFGILKAHFGQTPADWSTGDFDASGTVDLSDFGALKANFGAQRAVPEPAGGGLLVVGALSALAIGRWRRLRSY